jgi:sporulation protein YlmC with PRC-barrel domain
MRFEKGTEVFNSTGEKIGKVSRVVIDAQTKDVTDLVVDRGKDEKVVPVGLFEPETTDRLIFQKTNQNIEDLPDYETTHYVSLDEAGAPYDNVSYWYPPVDYQYSPSGTMLPGLKPKVILETESSIPEGRIAIAEGAQVISADDKHIGNVEQVIVNSETNNVTHFVVGKGFLLKEHKLVPSHWVTGVRDDKVHLSVEARLFDRLPDYEPQA